MPSLYHRAGGVRVFIGNNMSSTKQIEANIRNSQKSTGPKSTEGKAASAANAVKHGLLAGVALVQGESKADFEAPAEAYYKDLQPEGPLQEALVGEIIEHELWQRCFAFIEVGLLGKGSLSIKTV